MSHPLKHVSQVPVTLSCSNIFFLIIATPTLLELMWYNHLLIIAKNIKVAGVANAILLIHH